MFYLRYGNCEKWERYRIGMGQDRKTSFLYFMYLCEQNRHGHLASYAYYKSFFDRMTANMAFLCDVDKEPSYSKYYRTDKLSKLYKEIHNSSKIIKRAQKLRHKDPIVHASSELLGNNNSSKELKK
ncbi:Abia family HEPN domain-containing protein [Lactobacillus delbrueckii subsp. bulgaricus]